jgi:hypothetical protein
MAFTHTITLSLASAGVAIGGTQVLTADNKSSFDIPLTASQADVAVDVAFDKDRLQSLFIKSDKDLTIETNSTSEPGDTLTIPGGEPFVWNQNMAWDNPFSADVTKFYLTNGEAAAARVQMEFLYDPTP